MTEGRKEGALAGLPFEASTADRAQIERSLRESEERYQSLLTSIDIGFCVVDMKFDASGRAVDYVFLEVNAAFAEQTGLKDAVGKSMRSLAPKHEQHWYDTYAEVARTGKAVRFENPATALDQRWFDVYAFRVGEPGQNRVAILFRDISQRRRAENAVRERESVLRTVTNEARVGLVMINKERRYLFANQTYADILGLPDGNIVGKRVDEVLRDVFDQIQPRLDAAFAGERVTYELRLPKHPQTGDERFYEVVYEPRGNEAAEPYVVVVIVDITERKRAQQKLEELVDERTAKMQETIQELEAFSYSIAHDMRAPLRSMHGFANLVVDDFADQLPEEGKNYLRRIASSASRLDRLIQDVLNYSRIVRANLPLQSVDVETLVREIIQTYPHLHAPGVTIEVQSPLPRVWANVAGLTQIISNLLGNGVKFVKPGEAPRVRVWAETISCLIPNKQDTGCIRLWFEDNGIGIPKEWHARIFGMFHRLNPATAYEGTGIGLAIVRKAAERMGGRVGVESEPGRGSRFWVELQLPAS
ncbi:MAG TPA: ATP-binding protein [Verrucomicrobiae bacterium]|nr:ATP-binding protein [Verrucomicrobiae bacterium]